MSIESLTAQLHRFAQDREWEQFHRPRNLAMALSGEAGELLSLFQGLRDEQVSGWLDEGVLPTARHVQARRGETAARAGHRSAATR
jgi:NTP pyrophosphatase (non-canonical NTP hydrolase)